MAMVAAFLLGDAVQMNERVSEHVCASIMRLGARKSQDLLQLESVISCLSKLCLYVYMEKQSYVLTKAYCELRQILLKL